MVLMAYTRKRGNKFQALYTDKAGRQRSAGSFDKEDQALLVAEAVERREKGGSSQRSKFDPAIVTMDEYFPIMLRNHQVEPSTKRNYDHVYSKHIGPHLGSKKLVLVDTPTLKHWMAVLTETNVGLSTRRLARNIVSLIFKHAVEDEIIVRSPVRGIKLPEPPSKQIRIMSWEQFDKVMAALPTPAAQLLVELDIESGMRFGELTALHVEDFEFHYSGERARVHVRRSISEPGKKHNTDPTKRFLVRDRTKNGTHRVILIEAHISNKIEHYIKAMGLKEGDLLFPKDVLPTATDKTDEPFLGRDRWARSWTKAVRDSGLGWKPTMHELRHAHASWLIRGGADPFLVMRRLGHKDITTTQRYVHAVEDDSSALDAMANVRRRTG